MVKIVSIRPWKRPRSWPDRFYLEIVDENGGKYLWGRLRGEEDYWNRWSPRPHRAVYGWGEGMVYSHPQFFADPPPEIVEYIRCLQLGIAWRHLKAIRQTSVAASEMLQTILEGTESGYEIRAALHDELAYLGKTKLAEIVLPNKCRPEVKHAKEIEQAKKKLVFWRRKRAAAKAIITRFGESSARKRRLTIARTKCASAQSAYRRLQ